MEPRGESRCLHAEVRNSTQARFPAAGKKEQNDYSQG
jgi:hypothetical protein